MLYLTCTTISSVDLAQYGVSLAKDWVSVECCTMSFGEENHRFYSCKFRFMATRHDLTHVSRIRPFIRKSGQILLPQVLLYFFTDFQTTLRILLCTSDVNHNLLGP